MPAATLFDLPYSPDWGYEERFFLDNEHRYSKMHRLLRWHYGELSRRANVDLGCCRGQLLARFDSYPGVRLGAIEIQRLPFDDESIEVMLAGEIIEHIVDTEASP